MYGQEPQRKSLDDLWTSMEQEAESQAKPKPRPKTAAPRKSLNSLLWDTQYYGPPVPPEMLSKPATPVAAPKAKKTPTAQMEPYGPPIPPEMLPSPRVTTSKPTAGPKPKPSQTDDAVAAIEEINRRKKIAEDLFKNADAMRGKPGFEAAIKTTEEQADRELAAANEYAQQAAKKYKTIEVGFGRDTNPNSPRRWVYAKPKDAAVEAAYQPIVKARDRAGRVESYRKDYESSNPLSQYLQRLSTQYLSDRADNAPGEQEELDVRREAMGMAPRTKEQPGVLTDLVSRTARGAIGLIPTAVTGVAGAADAMYNRLNRATGNQMPKGGDWLPYAEQFEKQVNEGIAPIAPIDPARNEDFSSKLASGFGSAAGFGAAGAATQALKMPARYGVGLLGTGAGAGEMIQQAREAGFNPEDDPARWERMIALGGASGLTEIFGFGKMLDEFGLKRQFVKRAIDVLEEGGQEALQQFLGNVNAAYVGQFDKNRPLGKDVLENAIIGGIIGGTMQTADATATRLQDIAAIQATRREPQRPLNLTPSAAPGTQTQRVTVPPSFVRKVSEQPMVSQPSPAQEVVLPTEPLASPVAPAPASSPASPTLTQPIAPLFPDAQPIAPIPNLETLSPQDRAAAMLDQIRQQRQGRANAGLEQQLNTEFAEGAGLVNSAAQSWDTDRPTAEMLATTGAQRLKAALQNLQKSEAYQMELGAVASGTAQPGPYIAAAQSIQQQLDQADNLFRLDAERERQQAELAREQEKQQKKADKEAAKQAKFAEREQQKLARQLQIENQRAQTQAKRDEAAAKRMETARAAQEARRAQLEQQREQSRNEKTRKVAETELQRIRLHDAALEAADTAGQRHQEYLNQGMIAEAINELAVQQKQLRDAVRQLPRTPQAQAIKADLERYQGQIGNRIGDLRKQMRGHRVPVTQAIPPLFRADAAQNPEGGVPELPSFYEPGAVFDREVDAIGDTEIETSSLLATIRRLGGIRADGISDGELERLGVRESGTTGLVNNRGGLSPDRMREALAEEGLLPSDSTVDDLFQAIEGEMRGGRRGQTRESIADFYDRWEAETADAETEGRGDREQSAVKEFAGEEAEDMAALQRSIARSRADNPRPYDERTRPGEPGSGLVSFSQYAELERRNVEPEKALYNNEPTSETFKDAAEWITKDAAKAGIGKQHADAMVAYALNWHGEKAFWESQGLSMDTVQGAIESVDEKRAEVLADARRLPPLERTQIEREVAALDALFDDPDAVNLLERAAQGEDNAADEFNQVADEYGISTETAGELIRARRPVRRANPASQNTAPARPGSDSPKGQTETGREPGRSAKNLQPLYDLLRQNPATIPDVQFDSFLTSLESWRNEGIHGSDFGGVDLPPSLEQDLRRKLTATNEERRNRVKAKRLPAKHAPLPIPTPEQRAERQRLVEATRDLPPEEQQRQMAEPRRRQRESGETGRALGKEELADAMRQQQAQSKAAAVKMMLTRDDRQQLADLGYTRAEVDAMSPQEGAEIIASGQTKARTVTHPDPTIDGKPILAETSDGRVIVPNPENKTGISVVKDRIEAPTIQGNQSFSDMAERENTAAQNMIETIMTLGEMSREDAWRVFEIYQKRKLFDTKDVFNVGQLRVKSGNLLDRETLREAAGLTETEKTSPQSKRGRLALAVADHLTAGNKFANIIEARKFIAQQTGEQVKPGSLDAKQVDEAIEAGAVMAARRIVAEGKSPQETFRALLGLQDRLPTLSARTSTSVLQQAYSTPLPLAYVASRLAGIDSQTTVYEPSAGHSALLIAASPTKIVANELNEERAAALRDILPGAEITEHDAADWKPAQRVDRVITNPPFGAVKDDFGKNRRFQIDGKYETSEIDHAIAFEALKAMKDDGKAVLIVAGLRSDVEAARSAAYNTGAKRNFYFTLYNQYNVVDHFTVNGDLYNKQGAGWPVDIIVIDGRGKSQRDLPAVAVPQILNTWEAVGAKLDATGARRPTEESRTADDVRLGERGLSDSQRDSRAGERAVDDERVSGVSARSSEGNARPGRPADVGAPVADRPTGNRRTAEPASEPARPGRSPEQSDFQQSSSARASEQPGSVSGARDRQQGQPAGKATGQGDQPGTVDQRTDRGAGRTSDVGNVFDEEFAKLFGEDAAPQDQPAEPRPPRTTKEAAKSAAKESKDTLKEIAKGLSELFGGPKLSSGLTFDEKTYAAAKPHFEAAMQHFQQATRDVREVMANLLKELNQRFGFQPDVLQKMKPYIVRFVEEQIGQLNPASMSASESTAQVATQSSVTATSETAETDSDTHRVYKPASGSYSVGTLVPVNMASAVENSLARLQEEVGDLDTYVADRLGYKPDELSEYFSGEQIDAVALAVRNIENGGGLILGDQCVAAGTRIYNPISNTHTPIEMLAERGESITVLALTPSGLKPAIASAPFKKGVADLYRVVLDDGRQITVTAAHRFLTPEGWSSVGAGLRAGHFLASAEGRPACNLGFFPLTPDEDVPHLTQTPEDSLAGCSRYRRQCDEQLQSEAGISQVFPQRRGDARGHIRLLSRRDDSGVLAGCSHPHRSFDRLSRNNSFPSASRVPSLTLAQESASVGRLSPQKFENAPRSGRLSSQPHQEHVLTLQDQSDLSAFDWFQSASVAECHVSEERSRFEKNSRRTDLQCKDYARPQDKHHRLPVLAEHQTVQNAFSFGDYTGWRRIVSIDFIGRNEFFDLWVPDHENYVAEGMIHHNTGIGKGRVVAGIIRYAIKQKLTPIFVTEKPTLYGDMIRDLADIGSAHVKPLVTNAGESVPLDDDALAWYGEAERAKLEGRPVPAKRGKFLQTKAGNEHNGMLKRFSETGNLGGHHVIFTTYNQMQTVKGKRTDRHDLLERFARGGIVIFDESHNAGGAGKVETDDKGEVKFDRATFARQLARDAKGLLYSSATFAKRPEVMDLYFRTELGKAVGDLAELSEITSKGGVPMQQVIASMLAESGQYIRRERSFSGVEYAPTPTKVDRKTAENVSRAMREVARFDLVKQEAVKTLTERVKKEAKRITGDGTVGQAGVHSVNFTSLMHNLIDQSLLALKVDQAADMAIAALERGEKPVITVANTMGSFIQRFAEENELRPGAPITLSFNDLLGRYLERSREVIVGKPYGEKFRHYLSDEELGDEGVEAYKAAKDFLESLNLEIPISPIDWLHKRLRDAGYRTGEITGRGHVVNYTADGPVYATRPVSETSTAAKKRTIAAFNDGTMDVIILNQSGSTGISLHASEKFKDQRRRHMIIAQAEKNIDTHMQMLGRVHRTGQVTPPRYTQMVADIPAELRPAAVLAKKMASLNANTTASRSSAVTAKDVPDFLNKYGDEVAASLMESNPELHEMLGRPLKDSEKKEGYEREDAMRKVTGRIPLLPIKEQEEVYEQLIDEYADTLQQAEASGENALEAKTLDMQAETTKTQPMVPGSGASLFEQPANLERVSANRLGKPFKSDEVIEKLQAAIKSDARNLVALGRAGAQQIRQMRGDLEAEVAAYKNKVEEGHGGTKRAAIDQLAADKWLNRWNQITGTVYPGATVQVAGRYGVVLSVERKGKRSNPVALSGWRATVMMADGRRQLQVPFSKIDLGESTEGAGRTTIRPGQNAITYDPETSEFVTIPILEAFDKGLSATKETRYMVTGNLITGFGAAPNGQIVNFTDDAGRVRQGILMPVRFDPADVVGKQKEKLKTVEAVLNALTDARGEVNDREGNLTIRRAIGGGGYVVSVPSAKGRGGKYYLNRALLTAAGRDFAKRGGLMEVQVGESSLRRMVEVLLKGEGMPTAVGLQAKAPKIAERRGSAPFTERYTVRDLAANATVEYRPAANRPGTVFLNEWGHALVRDTLVTVYGEKVAGISGDFTLDTAAIRNVADEIRDRAGGAFAKFANTLETAAGDADVNGRDVAIVTKREGQSLSEIKQSVRHETVHAAQSAVDAELTGAATMEWLNRQPKARQIKAELERRGYKSSTFGFEAVAFVASGDFGVFGMSLDEATRLMDSYYQATVRKYGASALTKFGAIDPKLQPTLERARRETQPGRTNSDRATQDAGRSDRRAESQAGRNRAGDGGTPSAGQRGIEEISRISEQRSIYKPAQASGKNVYDVEVSVYDFKKQENRVKSVKVAADSRLEAAQRAEEQVARSYPQLKSSGVKGVQGYTVKAISVEKDAEADRYSEAIVTRQLVRQKTQQATEKINRLSFAEAEKELQSAYREAKESGESDEVLGALLGAYRAMHKPKAGSTVIRALNKSDDAVSYLEGKLGDAMRTIPSMPSQSGFSLHQRRAPKTTPLREIIAEHQPLVVDPYKIQDMAMDEILNAADRGVAGTLPGARALYWARKLKAKPIADKLANRQANFISDTLAKTNEIIQAHEAMRAAERGSEAYQAAKKDFYKARRELHARLQRTGEYAGPVEYLTKYLKASILTAPHILTNNVLDHLASFPFHEAQKLMGFLLPARALRRWGVDVERTHVDFRDLVPAIGREMSAIVKGTKDALPDFVHMLRYGTTDLLLDEEIARQQVAADESTGGADKYEIGKRAKGVPGLDQVITVVGRTHGAVDVMGRRWAFATAIASQADAIAKRVGKENGFTKDDIAALRDDLAAEPSPQMVVLAMEEANRFVLDYPTFIYDLIQGARKLGEKKHPVANKAFNNALDLLVKFQKIPLAAQAQSLWYYTPMGLVGQANRVRRANKANKAGKPISKQESAEIVERLQQGALGTLAWASAGLLGSLGYLTVAGGDDRERVRNAEEVMGLGYDPQLMVGNKAIELNRLGTFGRAGSVAARLTKAAQPRRDAETGDPEPESKRAKRIGKAFMKGVVLDNPVGRGLSDVFVSDTGDPFENFARGQIRSMQPGFLRNVAKVQDGTRRIPDTNDFAGKVKSDLKTGNPWLRKTLQPRLDALGNPAEEHNPFSFLRTVKDNPQLQEMIRLGTGLPKPKRDKDETAVEYNRRIAGFVDPVTGERVPGQADQTKETLRQIANDPNQAKRSDVAKARIYSKELTPSVMKRAAKLSEESVLTEREIEALRADTYEELRGLPAYREARAKEQEAIRKVVNDALDDFRARAQSTRRSKSGKVSIVREKAAQLPDIDVQTLARWALDQAGK